MRFLSPATTSVLLPIAGIFALSRIVLVGLTSLAATYLQPHAAAEGLSSLLCRWDCIWYLSVADLGYTPKELPQGIYVMTNYCFSPLFPLVVRFLGDLFRGNILYAGLVLTNLCFFAALVYVYRYARLLNYDRGVALLAVALICFLPESIVFSAMHSESLFLLLLVMAIFHARRGDYLVSGIAAALLSATRPNGVLFTLFAFALLLREHGFRSMLTPWRSPERFIPLVLAPLGMLAFYAYCFASTGDAFAQSTAARHGWAWQLYPVWDNVPTMLRIGGQLRFAALAGLATLGCSLLLLRERLYEEFAFCLVSVILFLSGTGVISIFRYWIVLFPVWVVVAKVLARRPVLGACVFLSVGLLGGFVAVAWAFRNLISL